MLDEFIHYHLILQSMFKTTYPEFHIVFKFITVPIPFVFNSEFTGSSPLHNMRLNTVDVSVRVAPVEHTTFESKPGYDV